jgi:hypothetical protein
LPQFFDQMIFIPSVMNPSNHLHINKWTFNSMSLQSNNIYTSCNQSFYYIWVFTHWNFLTSYINKMLLFLKRWISNDIVWCFEMYKTFSFCNKTNTSTYAPIVSFEDFVSLIIIAIMVVTHVGFSTFYV